MQVYEARIFTRVRGPAHTLKDEVCQSTDTHTTKHTTTHATDNQAHVRTKDQSHGCRERGTYREESREGDRHRSYCTRAVAARRRLAAAHFAAPLVLPARKVIPRALQVSSSSRYSTSNEHQHKQRVRSSRSSARSRHPEYKCCIADRSRRAGFYL